MSILSLTKPLKHFNENMPNTEAFQSYLEEIAKNEAVKKTGRGGKLEEALLVGGEEAEGAATGDKIDAEDGQEDVGM